MSVNGRPFKPDPTSYQMTGIPCGNPARYRSRGVIRMTQSSIPYENQQIGIPGQGTESAAEKELQNLIKNQFNASFEYSKKTVNFTAPARGGERLVPSAKGFLTLGEFQKVSEGDKESNQMRGLGFTDHQINHLLAERGLLDENLSTQKSRRVGNIRPNPDFVKQGIKEMLEAREVKEAELEIDYNFAAMEGMSRHRAQLESALLQNKNHPLADIYHKKAHGSKTAASKSNDFLLEEYTKPEEPKNFLLEEYGPVMKKFKVDLKTFSNTGSVEEGNGVASPISPSTPSPVPTPVSIPAPVPAPELPKPTPKPVVLSSKIDTVDEEAIKKNKSSEEEILKQFPNYEQGAPSKVLYVKNLDKQAGVKELVSLFIRFQEEGKDKISFKVMDGKMKGQAFVTFHDQPTAAAALELTHGYILNGKPLVIQYGKAK